MLPHRSGSFRFFKLFGVTVYIHWMWFLLVVVVVQMSDRYTTQAWAAAEYLSLFAIVLMHEFGHALACKSVGGKAEQIVLWPLGGVAFVQAPPRPGATLWSIAAGPLVNVALVPVTIGLVHLSGGMDAGTDMAQFTFSLAAINLTLLAFNMLPVYPLDGGQIVQSLLWFVLGRARSLWITAGIGILVGVAATTAACLRTATLPDEKRWRSMLLILMALFITSRAWHGFRVARMMIQMERQGAKF